ncbi:MAG TPA: hypothetical protein PK961_14225 [bacterium]|nr:hypothetical protein [bacterium]
MGFFNLDDVIKAHKDNKLEEYLADYDINDLALMQNELEGYAVKHNRQEDMKGLMITLANMLSERRETL